MQRNTKKVICQEALRMFSIRGYEGVSTKAIADAVGIKDSSLYNHFKSKRAIFDELQLQYQSVSEAMMGRLETACSNGDRVDRNSFQLVSDIFFENYLMDNFCNQFMRLMFIEQCNNSEMRQLYTKWMLDMPIQFQSKMLGKIWSPEILSGDDCAYLALKFYSPIYFYTHRYLLNDEMTDEKKNLFRMAVGKHIEFFVKELEGR